MPENNFKKKLANYIYNSRLKDEDKILWVCFLKIASPEENEAVYEAASESDDSLNLLTRHLAEKINEIRARA